MGSSKTDRRIARTRQALRSAFVDLILERGYPNVTIRDVAERANVGRSTFYAHYAGIAGILKESLEGPSSHLAMIVDASVSPQTLVALLEHFRDQRKLNKVFFAAPIRSIWVASLAEMIEARLALAKRSTTPTAQALPMNLIAQQLADTQIALIVNWLAARSAPPPEVIAQALIDVTRANVAALMG